IAEVLTKQNCRVWLVNIPAPGIWPHGFDIADAIADGGRICDPSEVLSWMGAADWLVEYVPEAEMPSENSPAPIQDMEPESEQLHESLEATGNQGGAGDVDDEYLAKLQKLKSEFGLVEGKDHGVNRKT
ncbi:DNA primase, partial [Neisseria meningitidis]|nr:DNA primase [Neisseria meningitidis]